MKTFFSEKEWADIISQNPKPCDQVKEEVWNRTRGSYVLKNIDIFDAKKDFQELENLNTSDLIKEGEVFSRYEYKWDLGEKYIDMSNVGSKSSNYFHQENRFKCDSINAPSPYRTWNDKKFFFTLLNALWTLKVKEVSEDTLRSCIALRKYIASQFRPSSAKAIYEFFKAKNVLDFSAGWGDRLCGFMASEKGEHYVGIDPRKENHPIYEKQAEFYKKNNGFFETDKK